MASILSLTPFGRADSRVFDLAFDAESQHAQRLQKYKRLWRYYDGEHWPNLSSEDREGVLTVNFTRMFVDFQAAFCFANGWKVVIPDDPATPSNEAEDREFVRNFLQDTWEKNKPGTLNYEAAQSASVSGDAFFRVSWEESDLDGDFVRVDVVPPQHVFPRFGGPFGVDRKRLQSVLLIFPRYKDRSDSVRAIPQDRTLRGDISIYAEHWFQDKVEIYHEDGRVETKPNVLGEIPVIHVANIPRMGEFYGISDIEDLANLQRAFNAKSTDLSDIIQYYGSPVTIVKGAKVKELERGPNKMWSIPSEAEISNLEMDGDLAASIEFVRFLKTMMHDIALVPSELIAGKMQDISASALALQCFPLIYRRQVKLEQYRQAFRELNRLILKVQSIMDTAFGAKLDSLGKTKYRNNVQFPDPFPRDQSIELDNAEKRIKNKLTSRRLELERMGYSQAEVERIIRESKEDTEEDMQNQIKLKKAGVSAKPSSNPSQRAEQTNRAGNPSPKGGNPDVRGEKRSRAADRSS